MERVEHFLKLFQLGLQEQTFVCSVQIPGTFISHSKHLRIEINAFGEILQSNLDPETFSRIV